MKTFAYKSDDDDNEEDDKRGYYSDDEPDTQPRPEAQPVKAAAAVPMKEAAKHPIKENRTFADLISGPMLTLVILVSVFLGSVIVRLMLEQDPWAWLLGSNGGGTSTDPVESIETALAPILALALAIERLIETIFDFFETNLKEVAKKTTGAAQSLDYIEQMSKLYTKQMNQAKDALQLAIDGNQPQEVKDKLALAVQKAEDLVLEAGNRLELLPKDPKYVSWKRAISILLALSMGMVVAVFVDKGVFYYLNFNVPRLLEMLLTGFILGAGSGPLHSLIGILQGAKDALVGIGNFNVKGVNELNKKVQVLSEELSRNR